MTRPWVVGHARMGLVCTMPFEDLQWDVKDPILAPRRILQAEPCVRLKGIAISRFDRKRGGSGIRPF